MNHTAETAMYHRLQVIQNSNAVRNCNTVRNFYVVRNCNVVRNFDVVQKFNMAVTNQRCRFYRARTIVHNTWVAMFAILISSPLWLTLWWGAGGFD
jgi:hypothetical protein